MRSKAEFQRIYGSEARAQWVRDQPCYTCGKIPWEGEPTQNSHIRSGGMGYKAGYLDIVPQCAKCHRNVTWFNPTHLEHLARYTESRWQEHVNRTA